MGTSQYGVDRDAANSRVALNYAGTRALSVTAAGADIPGTLAVGGTLAVTGALTQTGAAAFAAATTGVTREGIIDLTGATRTMTVAESGAVVRLTKASATQTETLPAATNSGVYYTFVCGHASGEILIDPNGTDTIKCKATNDAGASVAPAGGTGIKNTAATNIIGDYITLVADGVSQWDCVGQSGIWASQ